MAKKEDNKKKSAPAGKGSKKGDKTGKGKKGKNDGKPKKKRFLFLLGLFLLIAMLLGVTGIVDYGALYDQLMGKNKAVPVVQTKPKITGLQPSLASPQGIMTSGGFEVTDAGAKKVARIYEQMKPASAAAALQALPPAEAVKVLIAMDEWRAGIILSKMDAKVSADLTGKLATAVAQKEQYDKLNNSKP